MYRAYKFRIYPNDKQRILLNKSFGCVRFVYNYYLDKAKKEKNINAYSYIKDYTSILKYQYSFLQEVDSILIRQTIFNLENSYKNFFNLGYGYPKYKSKHSRISYTTNAIYSSYKDKRYCNIELDLINKKIKLPKIKWINARGYRNLDKIDGRIINATISKEPNSKYYVSLVYELSELNIFNIIPRNIVGLDLGIKKLMTLSDGITYDNNKTIEKYQKQINRINRSLSRKIKGSNNFYKCKQKLANIYSKLKNARKYYSHNITKKVTDNYDIITCEKLNTSNMITKNNNLSKKIIDATFYEIIRQLQYKSKYKGKYFYQIDTYYPSSQTCSVCNNIDRKYKEIKERKYYCNSCKSIIDRDLNASINIMFEGLKLYMKNNLVNI